MKIIKQGYKYRKVTRRGRLQRKGCEDKVRKSRRVDMEVKEKLRLDGKFARKGGLHR